MGYDFYGDFSTVAGDEAMLVGGIMIAYLVISLLSMAYSILVYVLHSLGMYTVANRRGIHHPWLAWIPVANVWILGSIADQYQYVAKGKVKSRRKVLLGLDIALYAVLILIVVCAFVVLFAAMEADMGYGMASDMVFPVILLVVAYLALLVLAIIQTVFMYIAYYDLYVSCNPNNAVAFLVLGIFFSFLTPYFVFAVRKKDLGMPPRKPAAEQVPAEPVVEDIPAIVETPVVEEAPVVEDVPVAEEALEVPEEPKNTEE